MTMCGSMKFMPHHLDKIKDRPGACVTGPGGESGLAGFWSAAGDALLMFPLSRTLRESLLQLACASMAQQGPAAASVRGSQGLQMRPREGATLTSAPVVGILLQLLLGCDDAAERNATLEALHCLIGASSSPATHLRTLQCTCCVCAVWRPSYLYSTSGGSGCVVSCLTCLSGKSCLAHEGA